MKKIIFAFVMLLSLMRCRSSRAFHLSHGTGIFQKLGSHPYPSLQHARLGPHCFLATSSPSDDPGELTMENIYSSWSIDDDRILFKNREKSLGELASILGRGLRGVETRLQKLSNVDSAAYARLFGAKTKAELEEEEKIKLVPAKEILRRIQFDYTLSPSDFSVVYYDRVHDDFAEVSMDAPNKSVKGNENLLVLAIPEHRIHAIKYKERFVWDKDQRLDLVSGRNEGESIQDVISGYDNWKTENVAAQALKKQRREQVSVEMKSILGEERFDVIRQHLSRLESAEDVLPKRQVEQFIDTCQGLFRDARQEGADSSLSNDEELDLLSGYVALIPEFQVKPVVLTECTLRMSQNQEAATQGIIPTLKESDLIESFVRGSGAGGQKINKTNSKVVLLHEPTQVRVECQETRSLAQNRKIARKRLLEKLDEHFNGQRSKANIKASKAAAKKQKAKARNKKRRKQKNTGSDDVER